MQKLSAWWGLAILLLPIACNKKPETTRPVYRNITESVYASGIVKSSNQYQVFATMPGIIKQLLVKTGDTIQVGSTIAIINNSTLQTNQANAQVSTQLAQAQLDKRNELQADIDIAKTKLDNEQQLLAKQQHLWQQGIGTRNELDARQLAFSVAQKTYQAALLRLQNQEKQWQLQVQQTTINNQAANNVANDYVVKSNTSGRVYMVYKEAGEMASSQTPIAMVGNARSFYLELQVDEYDIAQIAPQQKVLVTMDSYKGKVFEASIRKIYPSMNVQTKSFTVEADFVQAPPTLYPNLTVEANILLRQKQNVLTLPRSYVIGDTVVMLKNGDQRKVVTGLKDYEQIEIISGVTPNDVLVKPVL